MADLYFKKINHQSNYEEIVSVFSALIAKAVRDLLLTNENQKEFLEMLLYYQNFPKDKEGEE